MRDGRKGKQLKRANVKEISVSKWKKNEGGVGRRAQTSLQVMTTAAPVTVLPCV